MTMAVAVTVAGLLGYVVGFFWCYWSLRRERAVRRMAKAMMPAMTRPTRKWFHL